MALNTKSIVLISVGVALVLLIGLVISPAPPLRGGLPNYIDMLQAMRAFGKANEAYGRREYEEAIRYYQEATENAPEDNPLIQTTLHFFSASSNHLLYSPTTFDDPQNEEYLDNALDGYEDTIAAVEEALADPALDQASRDSIQLYERYASEQLAGIHRDHLDDLEGAEYYFNRLIEMNPGTPELYYGLADVYERFHDPEINPLFEKAIEAYKVPVEMNPDDPIAYRQVANLFNKYGRFDETMEWLEQARDVNPDNPEGYYLIATYYWDKVYRDPDLTERQRREFIDLGLAQLDEALVRNDEYVDALVYKNLLLRELAKVDPRNADALTAEADEYRNRAIAIRDRMEQEAAAAAAAAAEAAQER
ncbi:MAG: hypothetical protein OXT71_08925 [Acidobacteriota bacterium]|nr:hypothetical protein [Acidobacteriota bacterium]